MSNAEVSPNQKPVTKLRRYWLLVGGLLAFFLLLFLLVEAAGIDLLRDPSPQLKKYGWAAGVLGVVLLVGDVVLPVPSSIVMLAHGALFGVWLGSLLSLTGSMGAALLGFAIGRAGNNAIKRFVTPAEYERAARLLERWGWLAIVITRPVPLLAETVSVLAGASRLSWTTIMIASAAGAVPTAILYAIAGAAARAA